MPRFRHCFFWAGTIFLSLPANAAPPAPCDAQLEADTDPRTGYQLRERNRRCEGFYKARVAASGRLELIGLMRGQLRFEPDSSAPLTLKSTLRNQAVALRGIATTDKTYYRLDGLIPAGGSFLWKLADVVVPRHIKPDYLALTGRLDGQPDWYVPIVAGPEARRQAWVRGADRYAQVNWRHVAMQGENCPRMPDWRKAAQPSGVRGEPIKLTLPDALTGDICLEVAAKPTEGDDWQQGQWRLRLSD